MNREKVIKGLEWCTEEATCGGCPYWQDEDNCDGAEKMMRDALALLKASEPREGDTISRSALLAAYDAAHKGPPGGARKLIEEAPCIALKAEEPRVMTPDEMEQAGKNGDAVYVETPDNGCFWALAFPGFIPAEDKPFNYPCGRRFNVQDADGDIYDGDFYDMTMYDGSVHHLSWRCWTSHPTEEQMKAVKWG